LTTGFKIVAILKLKTLRETHCDKDNCVREMGVASKSDRANNKC